MKLYVDIEKKLADFRLKIKFETDNEVFGLLGASGSGKSMTLKCIAGIIKPDRGVICLGDRPLFDSERKINLPPQKRKVGYLFQDYALFPNMAVLQNISCVSPQNPQEYIERFYLAGKENLKPHQLSGGERQRLAIARMLAASPELIMFDEPFSSLDSHLKFNMEREIANTVEEYGGQAIFVSHDKDEIYRLTDKIAVLDGGTIAETAPKEMLFQKPTTVAAALLTGYENILEVGEKTFAVRASDFELSDSGSILCRPTRVTEDTSGFMVEFLSQAAGRLVCKIPKGQWQSIENKEEFRLSIDEEKVRVVRK